MKKRCAFTICTRSYLGLSRALKVSFQKYNEAYDFFIIIADYKGDFEKDASVIDSMDVMDVCDSLYNQMAFQYNVTEFCTSIKPFAFKWAFCKGYELAVYLDPDILVFSEFSEVGFNHSLYLTPHILDMKPNEFWRWKEPEVAMFGVYNCGFVAIKNDDVGNGIVEWWCEKLKTGAYSDIEKGMYTDQKWIDLIFCFVDFNNIKIIKHLGYNVAPWNYHEREFLNEEGFKVKLRGKEECKYELVFLHYSGYHYHLLIKENVIKSNYTYVHKSTEYDFLVKYYHNCLIEQKADKYFGINYGHGTFDNGALITDFNRRMFRRYIEVAGNETENPFRTDKGSFYELLLKSRMISKENSFNEIKKNIKNRGRKEKILQNIFKCVFHLLGADKYYYFIWKIHDMTRVESNYFLVKIL